LGRNEASKRLGAQYLAGGEIKLFWKKPSPQKARGSISHGSENQIVLGLYLVEEKIKSFQKKGSLQKARGSKSHRSKNQIILKEMKPPNG
jgi:hypothetical protein